jgi:hypothetical protein
MGSAYSVNFYLELCLVQSRGVSTLDLVSYVRSSYMGLYIS